MRRFSSGMFTCTRRTFQTLTHLHIIFFFFTLIFVFILFHSLFLISFSLFFLFSSLNIKLSQSSPLALYLIYIYIHTSISICIIFIIHYTTMMTSSTTTQRYNDGTWFVDCYAWLILTLLIITCNRKSHNDRRVLSQFYIPHARTANIKNKWINLKIKKKQ